MTKTYGLYSQFAERPNSLVLHKTVVCTEEEIYDVLVNFESQRVDYSTQYGPFPPLVEFFEEIV